MRQAGVYYSCFSASLIMVYQTVQTYGKEKFFFPGRKMKYPCFPKAGAERSACLIERHASDIGFQCLLKVLTGMDSCKISA